MEAPEFEPPALPTSESIGARSDTGFASAVLGVLAALANADGRLLEDELRVFTDAASQLLGIRWREPAHQCRALSLLCDPPDLDDTIKTVGKLVRSQHIAQEACRRAGDTVLTILEAAPQTVGERGEVASRVLEALQDHDPDHARRLALLRAADASTPIATMIGRLLERGGDAVPNWLVPRTASVNAHARGVCTKVAWLAEELDDDALRQAVTEIEDMLDDQPYRIVLVGEMKQGKSSLFNAIAGSPLSPVGESHATTAAVVELTFGAGVAFGGTWMSADEANRMLEFARDNAGDNAAMQKWASSFEALLAMPWFEPGQPIPPANTIEELHDYLAADGEFSSAVRRVTIQAPVETLRSNASLSDTPGLNDLIRPREDIALEEARRADCIVFVLNAEKLRAESERRFLTSLASHGRAVHLLPVMTRVDRLSTDEKRSEAVRQAKMFVEDCIRSSPVKVLDVLPINAARAAEEGQRHGGQQAPPDTDLGRLQSALGTAVADPLRHERYEHRVEHTLQQLRSHVSAAGERWAAAHEARLPAPHLLDEQAALAAQLGALAEHYRDHVTRQLGAIQDRMLGEHDAYVERIATVTDDVLAAVRGELDAELQRTGLNDKKAWARFDERLKRRVVESAIHRFEREQRERIAAWPRDLEVFQAEVEADLESALRRLEVDLGTLEGLTATHSMGTGTLLQAKEIVDSVNRKLLAATVGAGGAVVATGGVAGLLANASGLALALATAAPVVLVVGAVAGASWAVLSMMSKERAQKKLVDQKVDGARKTLETAFNDKPLAHKLLLEEVWGHFAAVAQQHYAPVIGTALAMSQRAQVQRQIWDRVREDGRALAQELAEGTLLDVPV